MFYLPDWHRWKTKSFFFFPPTSFLPLQISFCFFLTLLLFRLQSIATPQFFHNNFIEIKFTHHAIHSFKVHNLMTVHVVVHPPSQSHSRGCAPTITLNFRAYHYTERKPTAPSHHLPTPPSPRQPLATMDLLSVSTDWPLLDLAYKWHRTARGPL